MNLPMPITNDTSQPIIGESERMREVFRLVQQVAPTKATVLITGETGVGKDVIANAIHNSSPRKNKPFKAINCGAFYPELLQSELFGHEKGAFTGATNMRRGVFEQANGGTLFLDEVAEMSPEVQVKFLRVLETQEFTRLGGERNIKVDVRILAATNIDLATSVQQKKFRQDLYYRLNLFRIHVPPLRERRADIPLFVNAFISELNEEHGKSITSITPEALNYLKKAAWPGNVRELKNAVETAIIVATTQELALKDFPIHPEVEHVALPVQASSAELAPTQVVGAAESVSGLELPPTTEPLNVPGTSLQVVGEDSGAIATENTVIYKTIVGLIFSAIRLLQTTTASGLETPPTDMQFQIPDEDTSWMQTANIGNASDTVDILRKALEVLSTIVHVREQRTEEGPVPISAPVEQRAGSQPPDEYLPVLDEEEVIGRVGMTMAEIEREAIDKTLEEAGGNKTEAAKILDIGLRTLHRKLAAYKQEKV